MPYKTLPGETAFAARTRIARAKGFGSYSAYRRAGAAARSATTARLAERDPGYRKVSKTALGSIRTRQVIKTAAGRTVNTTNPRTLRRFTEGTYDPDELPEDVRRALDRQYAGLSHGFRLETLSVTQRPSGVLDFRAVVQVGDFDRRYRDVRRNRGRETGYRTVTWQRRPR